jgi:hypothetical protein
MTPGTQESNRRSGRARGPEAQEILDLPERETMTLVNALAFPNLAQIAPVDQTATPGASSIGDATATSAGYADAAMRSAPTDQTVASAQNVNSPTSTASATQGQYTPVTAPAIRRP